MSSVKLEWLARQIAVVAAVAMVILSALLIADGVAEIGRAAAEKVRVEALEERVLTEAETAKELFDETERQTERSLVRDARNRRLGWGLVVATVVFLSAAKWVQAQRDKPLAVGGPVTAPRVVTTIGSFAVAAAAPAAPSLDLAFVDQVIERQGQSREAAIPILQALQSHYRYLPEPAMHRVCEKTEISPSQMIGVASFYAQFRRQPVGQHLVRVCHGTACHVAGVEYIMNELRRRLEIPPDGDTDPDRRFTLDPVNCLGCCSLAPVMMIDDHVAGRLTPTNACQALDVSEAGS